MSYPQAFPTSFGSQLLHNGSTHFAITILVQKVEARVDVVELPDGTLFDPLGASQAPVVPRLLTHDLILVFTTPALCAAEHAALFALLGTKNTLTATKLTGGAISCSARLQALEDKSPYPLSASTTRTLRLSFQPLTNWS